MASSKSSATICDLFLIFNLLFFTFGTSSLTSIPVLHPPTPAATPPRSVQPGSGGHAPAPTPASPTPGNGGHGVPIPNPITPPASPPSGNGHGGPSPPARPPSGNGGPCPVKPIGFEGCAHVLDGSDVDLNGQCCRLVDGSVDINAPLCLCTAIRANFLKVNGTNNDVAICRIITRCGGKAPQGFQCPNY
ncbi:pEARLI1-like lipid transfer protein 1 [Dioscorea cayenensis subsp. rotundata]|uniref:PEARLI1-like lipid transfer protein 1 n=1 Tax=Dioscorea cayennensis subsp. rotundata TaxID=55577 RepID=A0AB40CRX8_DIOCR|nr:pEARLI1-like lipid transfer protein 1 [Dioscorea cayenensis subsp. rotundata]